MPFSKENRRFTLSLIAVVCIAALGFVSFAWLSHGDAERTYLYGTVVGGLVGVMCLQVMNLAKTNRVEQAVESGQESAVQRNQVVQSEIRTVKQMVELAEGMPRTPEELRAFIRVETPFIIRQTLAELKQQGWQAPPPEHH